jgi:hypothetical protein
MCYSDMPVIVPIGPYCNESFVRDTLDSIIAFCPEPRIILVDDSEGPLVSLLATEYDAERIKAPAHGTKGALYLNLSRAFATALREPFPFLLRLDTDARLLNSGFLQKTNDVLRKNPNIGCLGSYRWGYDGAARSRKWQRNRLLARGLASVLLSPHSSYTIWNTILRAKRHGYLLGESVLGGACIYSYRALALLEANKMLSNPALAWTQLEEDHIFSLCIRAVGMELYDFCGDSEEFPFGVKHRGLPASPSELVLRGKSIVHSTKFFGQLTESDIRSEFRRLTGN